MSEKLTRLTGENTTRYTNAQRAVDLTIGLDKVVSMILDSQDDTDWNDPNHGTTFPILDTPLVANQRDYGFAVSDDVLQIKDVQVSYDGTTYYTANPLDRSRLPVSPDSPDIDKYFPQSQPCYDVEGLSILIYPAPIASVGEISVRVSKNATPFTAAEIATGTKVPGIDRAFHYLIVLLAAQQRFMENNIAGNKLQRVLTEIEDLEARLRRQYGKKTADGSFTLTGAVGLSDYGYF